MGKKFMRQHIREYLKTSIYRSLTNSQAGLGAEEIRKKLSVSLRGSEEFDSCIQELIGDGLIIYDKKTGLWRVT